MLFWCLIGALLGLAAALKKGFNPAGGIIGGLLLGPLAFLMFFVSGISSADANRKQCPYCAEWVKSEAVVCKHCNRDIPAKSPGPPTRLSRKGRCPKCGYDVPPGSESCAQCGVQIIAAAQ